MYIPKNKIKKNQYTIGDKYVSQETGLPYIGFYYTLFNGDSFEGKNPTEQLKKLIPISEAAKKTTYNSLTKNKFIKQLSQFQPLPVYYAKPTEQDYKQGFMVRYFAKRRNGGETAIEEISRDVFDDISHMNGKYDYNLYSILKLYWQISGPEHDDNSNPNLPKPGIIDTNQRMLKSKEPYMSGISRHLSNLKEFANDTV